MLYVTSCSLTLRLVSERAVSGHWCRWWNSPHYPGPLAEGRVGGRGAGGAGAGPLEWPRGDGGIMADTDYDGEISPGGETKRETESEREKQARDLEMNVFPMSCGHQGTTNSCADGHCEGGGGVEGWGGRCMILIFKVLKV